MSTGQTGPETPLNADCHHAQIPCILVLVLSPPAGLQNKFGASRNFLIISNDGLMLRAARP